MRAIGRLEETAAIEAQAIDLEGGKTALHGDVLIGDHLEQKTPPGRETAPRSGEKIVDVGVFQKMGEGLPQADDQIERLSREDGVDAAEIALDDMGRARAEPLVRLLDEPGIEIESPGVAFACERKT